MNERWRPRLSNAAETDFAEIIAWTESHFGAAQAEKYAKPFVQRSTNCGAGLASHLSGAGTQLPLAS